MSKNKKNHSSIITDDYNNNSASLAITNRSTENTEQQLKTKIHNSNFNILT